MFNKLLAPYWLMPPGTKRLGPITGYDTHHEILSCTTTPTEMDEIVTPKMDNVDPITELSTIADIEASTDVLSIRTNAVVRVKERYAVKIGYSIPLLKAENMKFVAANSKFPVPKVHANFFDPETHKRYIIMDYIPGADLQKLFPSLTLADKTTISQRTKQAIDGLRSIPPPKYFGDIDGASYIDGVPGTPDNNPAISGPFRSQEQMNQGILQRLGQT